MSKKHVVYPYIPNSVPEIKAEMLREVNAKDEMELFDVIPDELLFKGRLDILEAIGDEYSIKCLTTDILNKNTNATDHLCFLDSGCALHFIPALCDEVATLGELLTSYAGSGTMDVAKG